MEIPCSQGFSLNPIKMETYYGLIAGSAAAAPGVTAKNARYLVFDGKITVSLVFSFYSAVVNLLKSIQLHFMQIQILSIWKSCTYFLFSS